jgi:hypothetical protein
METPEELDQRLITLLVRKGLRAVYYAGLEDGIAKAARPSWDKRLKELSELSDEEIKMIPLDDLNLSKGLTNNLKRARLYTVGDTVSFHNGEYAQYGGLLHITGVGKGSFRALQHLFAQLRIELQDHPW